MSGFDVGTALARADFHSGYLGVGAERMDELVRLLIAACSEIVTLRTERDAIRYTTIFCADAVEGRYTYPEAVAEIAKRGARIAELEKSLAASAETCRGLREERNAADGRVKKAERLERVLEKACQKALFALRAYRQEIQLPPEDPITDTHGEWAIAAIKAALSAIPAALLAVERARCAEIVRTTPLHGYDEEHDGVVTEPDAEATLEAAAKAVEERGGQSK